MKPMTRNVPPALAPGEVERLAEIINRIRYPQTHRPDQHDADFLQGVLDGLLGEEVATSCAWQSKLGHHMITNYRFEAGAAEVTAYNLRAEASEEKS